MSFTGEFVLKKEISHGISQVITATQEQDGIFYVNTLNGKVNLAQILGDVIASNGLINPLGMTSQFIAGTTTIVLAVYIFVLSNTSAGRHFVLKKEDGKRKEDKKDSS